MAKVISKSFSWTSAQRKEFFDLTVKNLSPYLIVLIPVIIDQLPKEAGWAVIAVFLLQRALSFFRLYVVEVKK